MIKKYIASSFLFLFALSLNAQTSLDFLFESVLQNNKTIKSYGLYYKWQKQANQVGLTPDNPEVEFGYFPGNSDAIGTKKVFGISQTFDFPTAYIHKKKLAKQGIQIADKEFQKNSQKILLNTWKSWAKAIYLNKKNVVLNKRQAQALKMLEFYEKKQSNGDATQLEVNKAKLFLIDIENKTRLQNAMIKQNNEELIKLNGGLPITIDDTSFTSRTLQNWEEIAQKLKEIHPEMLLAKQNELFANYDLKLSKAAWLPSFTVAYESEDVMGDIYSGLKAGIKIPLWQQKGTISAKKAQIAYTKNQSDELNLNLLLNYKQKHLQVSVLLANLSAFEEGLNQMNNDYLLARSLELGQISAIEYFMELNYFYEITDQLFDLELEYQLSLAELYDFTLM